MNKVSTVFKLVALFAVAIILGSTLATSLVSADKLTKLANSVTSDATNTIGTAGNTGSIGIASNPNPNVSTCNNNSTQELQTIITRGNQEINRRLASLSKLSTLISSASKLTPSDQTYLQNEVSSTVSGLQTLQTQLDSATTVCTARTDAQNIFSEYRVYALVVPKVWLVKEADDQQVAEAKLSTLAGDLQTRLTNAGSGVPNLSQLQSDLTSMQSEISSAQSISSSVESSVIYLTPSDYDLNHSVLEGYNTQLKTARQDNQQALAYAKDITAGLKKT
ncbi:MAG TPA: hypothetical protein VL989_01340 [Candidatus Sulfotelmatobacter sp.]|nr:hypothetical protein [Candidatus Sulfotelmatobacter sp.]